MGGFGNKITSFDKMPQIKTVPRDSEKFFTEYGTFFSDYKDEYLQEGEGLTIYCDRDGKVLKITASKRLKKGEIALIYNYDIKTKQLKEGIQYHGENDHS